MVGGVLSGNLTEHWNPSKPSEHTLSPAVLGFKMSTPLSVTQVTWEEPVFSGFVGTPMPTFANNRVFIWGRYSNWYVAQDANGNAAVCAFDIYVRNQDCPTPDNPVNGIGNCFTAANSDGDFWPYRSCLVTCSDQYAFPVPTPDVFTCGPQGAFNVENKYLGFRYPACGPTAPKTDILVVQLIYRDVGACDAIQVVDGFAIQIYERLNDLNVAWLSRETGLGGFCGSSVCDSSVVTVETECTGTSGRRRRQASDAEVTITIPNVQDPLMDANDNSVERLAEEILTQDILDNNGFDFSNEIANGVPDVTSLQIETTAVCPEGQVVFDTVCVQCSVGTFYDVSTSTCQLCPLGTYQNQTGQSACVSCESGFTTELEGSQTIDDCAEEVCAPGYFYDAMNEQCVMCEIGFYQNLPNQYFCIPCDADRTTTDPASTSIDDCFEVCSSGTELVADGTCEDCAVGTYRTLGQQPNCVACPMGYVTLDVRSLTIDDCSIRECFAGTFISTFPNGTEYCEPCAKGSYQSADFATSCIDCGESQTTLSTGSTMPSECKFFCPEGQDDPNELGQCTDCAVGFYKDNAEPDNLCMMCRAGFVTPAAAATSVDNCTVLACSIGQSANAAMDDCEYCPVATYQDELNAEMCKPCPDDTTTRTNASTMLSQCEEYCPDGQEDRSGSCVLCSVGFFRNSTGYEFSPCLMCPDPDFITAGNGSVSASECTIANCSAGYYRNVTTNMCMMCGAGEYQPEPFQTQCISCGNQTTSDVGSTSADDCRLECNPGFEDAPGVPEACVQCPRGTFKSDFGVQRCDTCTDGFITELPGTTSNASCTFPDCQPGQFVDMSGNTSQCSLCPRGQYTDSMWQTGCVMCAVGETTLAEGADSADDCVTDCASGSEYDMMTMLCVGCMQGYYRTQTLQDICVICPDPALVTSGVGEGFTVLNCDTPNCTAGSFINGSMCSLCAVGEYQSDRWKDECEQCEADYTTNAVGSTSQYDCILECSAGREYDPVTRDCEDCALGQYKSDSDGSCQSCPDNTTTAAVGSTSATDCNIRVCEVGQRGDTTSCIDCEIGTYQPLAGQPQCTSCPTGYSTFNTKSNSSTDCQNEDDCNAIDGMNNCAAEGGVCNEQPGLGSFVCDCLPGYSGDGTSCLPPTTVAVDVCASSTPYCEHDGVCSGSGQDVSCDCSDTNFKGSRCETRKDSSDSNQDVLIGSTIGGGLGLILLILISVAICFCCFRADEQYKRAPPQYPLVAVAGAPSVFTSFDNTLQSGIITKPATRYGGSTLANSTMFYNGDGASIAGFPSNQKYLIYDESDDTPIMQNGYSNSVYDGSMYEERGSTLRFT